MLTARDESSPAGGPRGIGVRSCVRLLAERGRPSDVASMRPVDSRSLVLKHRNNILAGELRPAVEPPELDQKRKRVQVSTE